MVLQLKQLSPQDLHVLFIRRYYFVHDIQSFKVVPEHYLHL